MRASLTAMCRAVDGLLHTVSTRRERHRSSDYRSATTHDVVLCARMSCCRASDGVVLRLCRDAKFDSIATSLSLVS